MPEDLQEHQRRAARIEQLIDEVSVFPDPHARATTEELLQVLLDMYGEGLARILEVTAQLDSPGQALMGTFASDDLLSALFMLHGLHPVDLETRIGQALDEVRPYLKSHGGNVEFVRLEGSVAHLRLEGSCHGCPSSTMTLKLAIEEAIYKAAPDLDDLRVEGVTEPPRPVTFVPRRRKENAGPAEPGDGWAVVSGLGSLSMGELKVVSVTGESLLFCKVTDTTYAYRNSCSSCHVALDNSRLTGTTLTCDTCKQRYDVCRAGRCLDAPDLFLEPVPLLEEGGKVKIALPALADESRPKTAGAAAKINIHSA